MVERTYEMAMKIKNLAASDNVCEVTITLSEEIVKGLMNEYPGFILKHVMEAMDCAPLGVLYSSLASRPCYPVNIIIGILLLSIFTGFSHEMILKEIRTNLSFRIALGVHTDPEFVPPDERTVDRFLERVCEYYKKTGIDLLMLVLRPVLSGLCKDLDQEGVIVCRMDSTLIDNYLTREFRNQLIYCQMEVLVLKLVGTTKAEVARYTKAIHPSIENIIPLHEGEKTVPFVAPVRPAFFDTADLIGLPLRLHCFFDADDYNKRFYNDKGQDSKKIKQEEILVMAKELMDFCQERGYTNLPEYNKLMNVLYFQCDLVKVIHPGEDPDSVKQVLRLKPKNSDVKEAEALTKQRTKLREGYEKAMAEYEKAAGNVRVLKDKLDLEVGNSKVKRLQEQYDKAIKKQADLAQIVEGLKSKVEELDKQEATEDKVIYDELWMANSHNMGSSGPQSHVDHSATYTRKYNVDHIGDKLTVIEGVDAKGRSRVIGFAYGPNNVGDASYGAQAILEANKVFPLKGKCIVADAAFCGEGIEDAANTVGAILVNTNLIGTVKDCCADHEFSSDGKTLTKCAGGQVPLECASKNEEIVKAKMSKAACESCPHFGECKPRATRENYILETSVNQKERAMQKREMGSETHNVLSRLRNGSEATMNLAQRVFPIPDKPIYGLERKRIYATIAVTVMALRKGLAQSKIKDPYPLQNHDFEEVDDYKPEQNCKETSEVKTNNLGNIETVDATTPPEKPVEKKIEMGTDKDSEEENGSKDSPGNNDEDRADSFESKNDEADEIENNTVKDYEEECESGEATEKDKDKESEDRADSFEYEKVERSQDETAQTVEDDSTHSSEYYQALGLKTFSSWKACTIISKVPVSLWKCENPLLILLKTRLNIPQEQMILPLTELGVDIQQAQVILGLRKQWLHVLWDQMNLNPWDAMLDIPLDWIHFKTWSSTVLTLQEMPHFVAMDTTLHTLCNSTVSITNEQINQCMEINKYQLIRTKIFLLAKAYHSQIVVTGRFKPRDNILSSLVEPNSS